MRNLFLCGLLLAATVPVQAIAAVGDGPEPGIEVLLRRANGRASDSPAVGCAP